MDLRQRVVGAFQQGEGTYEDLARRFGVGRATVHRWLRRTRETGSPAPLAHAGGQTHRIADEELAAFRALVDAKPDRTRAEMAQAWAERTGTQVSVATIGRTLARLGYTLKKSPLSGRASATGRAGAALRRPAGAGSDAGPQGALHRRSQVLH